MDSLWILYVAIYVLIVAGWWMIFTKAGQEGWKAIIPFYNFYIVLKIVGREALVTQDEESEEIAGS